MTLSITKPTETKASQHQDDIVLSAKGVSKKFCRDLKRSLFYGVQDIAGQMTGLAKQRDKLRPKEFWALQNVSFELRRGEALGLVGKNGSGKSTLLRIIAGLIKPDMGSIEVKGRIAPLIALGAGFNPILTGRENIYANMSILGLSKQEIDERFDDVIEFSEIGDAIDAPLQSYSSGMAARLGFASAIHTEPEILLIDEVLAVGDIKFRAKCYRKLYDLREKGVSFVLVSHQAYSITNVCNSAIFLSDGQLISSGDTDSIMKLYEKHLFQNCDKSTDGIMVLSEKSKAESTGLDIIALFFRDAQGNILKSPITGETTYFCVRCKSNQKIENAGMNFSIHEVAGEGDQILHLSSFKDKRKLKIPSGEHEIQVQMPSFGLKPSIYRMTVNLRKDSIFIFDMVNSFRFTVESKEQMSHCRYFQPRQWVIVEEPRSFNLKGELLQS